MSWRTASLGDPFQPPPCAIQGYNAEHHCCWPGFMVQSFIILWSGLQEVESVVGGDCL